MKVYVRESPQHGRGVFAAQPIARGTGILQFAGPVLQVTQVDFNDYHLQIGSELYLGPSGEADDFVNHSCDPNAALADDLSLVALRDIHADEEITWDYSTAIDEEDFTGFPCGCGAVNCRNRITSFRYLDQADQQRLAAYLLPYLRAQHSRGDHANTLQGYLCEPGLKGDVPA